jgi:hypothetical protein
MMDKKKKHELSLFKRFAKVSALRIIPESIEQPLEPEPDILCEILGEGRIAFELTRIDDEAFLAIMTVGGSKQEKQFKEEIAKDLKTREHFRGAHISPDKPITGRKIVATLRSAPHDGEHLYLRAKNIDIERTRASHDPRLCHDMVEVVLDPLTRIQRKIKNVQQGITRTPHPIEILAYFDIQRTTEEIWQDRSRRLQAGLPALLSVPQVKRVWIYHNLDNKVMYVYPAA